MTSRLRLLVAGLALVFAGAHLRTLPATLEDIDSINFALAVESFDVASHRPHPPGYPVFVGMAKASTAVVGWVVPSVDRDRRAATGLALWGLVAGALAAFALTTFWLAAGMRPSLAFLAAAVAMSAPLFWFTASRPLSDTAGAVAALVVQAMTVRGLAAARARPPAVPPLLVWAAAAGAFVVGLRSQTVWLTAPLLLWAVLILVRSGRTRGAMALVAAALGGALLWAVPLVWTTGGVDAYLRLLSSQGAMDFEGVHMLATEPSWALLVDGLRQTFLSPWLGRGLANVVTGLAAIGLIWLAARDRRQLALVAVAFMPYLVFHLVFMETSTLRYGLPVVVPVAGLAVTALAAMHRHVATAGGAALVAASLLAVAPRLEAYATDGSPLFRAFQDMLAARTAESTAPVIRMHHQVWWDVQRVQDWYRPVWDTGVPPFPGDREWLDLVEYWRSGDETAVWFLAAVTRTDLRLFDPRASRLAGRYVLARDVAALIGGERLDRVHWWRLGRPRWMAGAGWALTPEAAGMTLADGTAPHLAPAEAFVLRGPQPVRMLVGGRYLSGTAPAVATASLDGAPLDRWTVAPEPEWFARWINLPAGVPAGEGPYARLTVAVEAAEPSGGPVVIGLEQFDAAVTRDVVVALVEGWHEPEEEPHTDRFWRWTSEAATLVVRTDSDDDLRLRLAGESPVVYFGEAVSVVVRIGGTEVARRRLGGDFDETFDLPAAALRFAEGRVTIEPERTFVPGERDGGPDRRRLGLRLYRFDVVRR